MALAQTATATTVQELQQGWAIANYELEGDNQATRFEALIAEAEAAVAAQPKNPELLIWEAILKSTYAGKASGLSALSLVKGARSALEKALSLDDMAMQGSAYTSLGALYYQVPGWPIAFGSDKKARQMLEKAVQLNPAGIDSNYFYGDFLLQKKEYGAAKVAFEKALAAPDRPGRTLADSGRRGEIRSRLANIES
ncbi:MAG: tetratricopeptide (TPR) repeat protein [Candidatus Azotimanducaceae bacterium]|jgi:tetratricopeptide (TPR) repeat protein